MLASLQVRDFAIVDRISVELDPGMTVLTGETGAGKSILVDALALVLGERGSAQLVRPGAKRAEFSAEFDVTALPAVRGWLDERSLETDDACLLRRVIGADGRSRAWINGNAVTLAQLQEVGEMLVDIHGQHFHQSLVRRPVQRELLDHFGGVVDDVQRTSEAYTSWQAIEERLRKLRDDVAERASRIDLLRFQVGELEALDLQDGEYDELLAERRRLQHGGRLATGVATALGALYEAEGADANSLVAAAARALEPLAEWDERLGPAIDLVDSAGIQIREAAELLSRYAETLDSDPERADAVEERLAATQAAARKHRVEPHELPTQRETLSRELDELVNAAEVGASLEAAAARAHRAYLGEAEALSAKRRRAADAFGARVTDAMQGLGMQGGRFEIAVTTDAEHARAHGIDDVRFEITANPGQPLQPLAKIASGGELSRMSLAIQVIASDGSRIPTMVFDEVDSGVGGGVAEMVGRRLAELGASRQVLCVTHLPQVASLADSHFRVTKVSDSKSTRTQITPLEDDERIQELARMLGGVEITRKTLDHAAEMLEGTPKKRA